MASAFLDWTRFAEEQGWDSFLLRRDLPVKTWIKEKRDILAARQMDILSGLIHDRKFKWTHEIINTLDNFPPAIDMALQIAKAKMSQVADMFKDYQEFMKDPARKMYKNRRVYHPFEKLSMTDISMIMKGMKDITEAKLKALMLDKWAISKLDLPLDEVDGEGTDQLGPKFTIEGKEVVAIEDMQNWFDRWIDKPPQMLDPSSKTVSAENPSSSDREKRTLTSDEGTDGES